MRLMLALVILLSACTAVPMPRLGAQLPSPAAEGAVVALVQDNTAYCSGVVIDSHGNARVLTAAHCVDMNAEVDVSSVADFDGEHWPEHETVRVLNVSVDLDLAILDCPPEWAWRRLRVTNSQPLVGDVVRTMGHASGLGHVTHFGHVSTTVRGDHYFIDAGLIPGMSGGPVVDANGEVCGINQFVRGSRLGWHPILGGVASVAAIHSFLG